MTAHCCMLHAHLDFQAIYHHFLFCGTLQSYWHGTKQLKNAANFIFHGTFSGRILISFLWEFCFNVNLRPKSSLIMSRRGLQRPFHIIKRQFIFRAFCCSFFDLSFFLNKPHTYIKRHKRRRGRKLLCLCLKPLLGRKVGESYMRPKGDYIERLLEESIFDPHSAFYHLILSGRNIKRKVANISTLLSWDLLCQNSKKAKKHRYVHISWSWIKNVQKVLFFNVACLKKPKKNDCNM